MLFVLLSLLFSSSLFSSNNNHNLIVASSNQTINVFDYFPQEIRVNHLVPQIKNCYHKCILLTKQERNKPEFYYTHIIGKELKNIAEKIAIERLASEQYDHTYFTSTKYNLHHHSKEFINRLNFFYNAFVTIPHHLILHCHKNLLERAPNESLLHLCKVKNINSQVVKLVIEKGADINYAYYDLSGLTPVCLAIMENNKDMVKILADWGANINIHLEGGITPIWYAIHNNNAGIVQLLIEYGAMVNVVCDEGTTPVYYAAEVGSDVIVDLLIKAGAEVNEKPFGKSLLSLAIKKRNYCMISLLIKGNANVNLQDDNGKTPLCHAIKNNDLYIMDLLLQAGANVNHSYKDLPLLLYAISTKNIDAVELLTTYKADVNLVWFNGLPPVAWAIRSNDQSIIKLLIRRRANVNLRYGNGSNALHQAVEQDNLDTVELLIRAGADVKAKVKEKGVLHYAHSESMRRLLRKHGAEEDIVTTLGKVGGMLLFGVMLYTVSSSRR